MTLDENTKRFLFEYALEMDLRWFAVVRIAFNEFFYRGDGNVFM